MVHLVYAKNLVPRCDSAFFFGRAPRTGECSFDIGVLAQGCLLQQWILYGLFHACLEERKGQFVGATVRQHGMKQSVWMQHGASHQAKGQREVRGSRRRDDDGTTKGAICIHTWVKTPVIVAPNLLAHRLLCLIKQATGVGSSNEERVARIQRTRETSVK